MILSVLLTICMDNLYGDVRITARELQFFRNNNYK